MPTGKVIKVHLIEDQRAEVDYIREILSQNRMTTFSITHNDRLQPGIEALLADPPDVLLLDLCLPQMSGMEVLRNLVRAGKNIPVIMLTGHGSVHSAVRAIKLGAIDYIEKPFDNGKLKQTVNEGLKERKSSRKLSCRQDIIGESPQIQKVWRLIEKYGPTDLPILLQGETGTG